MTPRTSAAATSGDTSSPAALRFGILGPLDVAAGGESLALGGPKQRELLAVLLLHLNQFVPPGRLAEALWGAAPPAGAEVTLRTHVSHLRRRLAEAGASGALATRRSGYGLLADPAQLDAARFEQLVGLGREALGLGDAPRAATLLRQALDLWRGPVLEDLHAPLFAEAETARLDELRLVATESRIEADLALGRHAEAVPELERLVDVHPFRERLTGQLMLALYRTGRQVDALDVAARARRRLADELGLDPGPALAGLETSILRHDPALLPAPRLVAPTGTPAPRVQPPPDALFTVVRRVPMAGRGAELAHLRSLWHDVRDGGRRVALVSGEGGVGKTRLVAEFAHEAAADAHVLVGRCDPAAMLPYHPIASAFRASAEVDACLDLAPPALRARLTPLLSRPADTTPGPDDRHALFEAATWVLTHLAGTAPVALVVEEAERLDRASSLLLRHLVEHLPARVLLVVCFRDPPGGHHPPLLDLIAATEGLADRLTLGPLTETELAELVTAVAGDVPAGFVPRLWRATGGNPFYAAEVARDRRTREDWQRGQVPAGVRDVVRHRLRSLPEPAQHVVRCAAVLGPEAGYELLAHLADQPEEQLIDALVAAVAAGFLVEAGRSWQVAYAFPHDLLRDAVHADLPVPRRQRLHLRAAQLLRDRPAETASAAVHLRAAGPAADPLDAAELSLAAAGDAQRMYAWDEAIAHAEAAVAILDQAGAPAPTRADAAVRTAILRLRASTGFPEAVRLLEHALELYRGNDEAVATVHARLGGALCTHHSIMDIPRALDHFAAARRVLPDGRAGFHLHRGRAQAAMYGLRTATLGAAADQARELAARLGRRDLTVLASWAAAWFRFNRGELAAAAAIEEDMWARVQDLGDPYVGWGPVNMAALTATEYLLDPVAGRRWCRRGLSQARFDTLGYPHDAVADQLVLALALAGDLDAARRAAGPLPADAVSRRLLLLLDGDWEAAEHAWSQARAADEAAGDRHDAAFHARWLATTRTLLGDTGGAVTALRQALDLAVAGPQVPTELIARAELARLLAATDPGEAARHLARCDEILAGGEDWRGRAGTVALARAAVTGDDTAYQTALRLFAGLPWHRADALRAWAAALDTTGRRAEAGEKLAAARRIHDEIGAHPRWRH